VRPAPSRWLTRGDLNTTTYTTPSVTDLLRRARNEAELDALLAEALRRVEASAATDRKWRKVTEETRGALRVRALEATIG
jgi:hypothetical protein